uniref:Uncharacterized protein n=1 Tax=Aegilops tauschii subsp. strangulata TaxID=200361 RepID=A0A453EW82_AEGTS
MLVNLSYLFLMSSNCQILVGGLLLLQTAFGMHCLQMQLQSVAEGCLLNSLPSK